MEFLLFLVIGVFIGWVVAACAAKHLPHCGLCSLIVAGAIGAWIGSALLPPLGPIFVGVYLFSAILGALIFILLAVLLLKCCYKKH
ncbi:GlsB/YeaQ/YmgE family stress response membrane protein [Jeotgalibacillus sp. ET6]|uniref:GlsB/YeaQ/YmgE family stress response membrane protein n=1 Tax=Jeotgalibacillus sp. ET6 TaxID=3037260 RepID=UPI00241883AF|nr:GlsB/YeaQ/YmgE family stress response membrane protein [Jeotgalibacillus sp. ET6]MDG5472248.1 GlsB/YeaQ/YmgE family stress response membrane protein [Jeotgalibacillus sp. ET6]